MNKTETPEFGGYNTQNADLAAVLHTCGIPFYHDGENVLRLRNIYDLKILKSLGLGGQNLRIDKAAQKAYESGKHGNLFFYFEPSEAQQAIVKAWDETNNGVKAFASGGPATRDAATIDITAPEVATIVALVNANKRVLLDSWKGEPAFVQWGKSKSEPGAREHHTVISGSFKLCSIYPTEDIQKELGIL